MSAGAPPARRTRRGEERDARLRQRAADLFLERGYDGVSVDELIRDVGGSKASVYQFYGDKDGLFTAVMEDTLEDLIVPLMALDLEGLSLRDGLKSFATMLLSTLLQPRHLAFQRLVITEALRHPAIGLGWYRDGPAATCELLQRFLAEQQRLGHIRPDVALGPASVLFHDMVLSTLLNRAVMAIEGGPTPEEMAAKIEHAVRLMLAGIAPPARG
ncbi:TetR/AcrR family transcriptional regulator [Acidocella sp.]|jgi:AcrR family transcriptional regulator|uniref:TetR/AcrR family transcriptional regulator n=1 Tax=Acidocella sp. TaxID=50710 RepID=UPI002F3FB613